MGVGMEGTAKSGRLRKAVAALVALGLAGAVCSGASGQAAPETSPAGPQLPSVAKECGEFTGSDVVLPNSGRALQERKTLKILAIGASTAAIVGGVRERNAPLLEQLLERSIKGLDVEIINRGFSGELAEAAASRLKIEIALNHPDLVLWQVGTNDALAQVPVEEFQASVSNMVRWLKDHNVDVILIGLHYTKNLAKDPHYQAIRASLRSIAVAEHVPRVGRYETMEVVSRMQREAGQPSASDFGQTEAGYNCMAQYLARTIAVGLFAKLPKPPATPMPTR